MTCLSIIQTAPSAAQRAGAAPVRGYGPFDLRKAYGLTAAAARKGRGRTVAIVDAFSDPKAAADLARYRRLFHLRPCGVASGCLRIVNEHGGSHLPIADRDWATEESLDLDMVSAICPRCRILLVEASAPDITDLGTAVDTAVRMGARYVSDSWGGSEIVFGLNAFDHFFNHPGTAISFAAGDSGYRPGWPADLQYVTSVGGTSLRRASGGRGFAESVWGSAAGTEGTGSGCSALGAKPSWQRMDATEPAGCLNRTMNDVAAVADPNTGVAVIDTYLRPGRMILGGTSVATPIVTSIYALAAKPTPGTYPAEYPYLHATHLFPVTSGANGLCEPDRQYLCTAEPGYDGPTGLGTPDGTGAFTDHGRHRVTLVDPGTTDAWPGQSSVAVRITGLDTRKVSSLRFSATGLPTGMSIHAIPRSTSALISGTLPGTPGTFHVTVTARDGTVTGTTHFMIVTVPSLTTATATAGQVSAVGARTGVRCLDDGGGGTGTIVRIQACDSGAHQQWVYTSDGKPTNDAGALSIDGLCLKPSSRLGNGVLAACNGHDGEHWQYRFNASLRNVGTLTCLSGAGIGSAVKLRSCQSFTNPWQLPALQLASGAGQLCVTSSGALHAPATVAGCANSPEQQWTMTVFHDLVSTSGLCLTAEGTLSGASVQVAKCRTGIHRLVQLWLPFTGGQLINVAAMRCLADPGAGGPGTALTLQDCYGEPGEVWGLN